MGNKTSLPPSQILFTRTNNYEQSHDNGTDIRLLTVPCFFVCLTLWAKASELHLCSLKAPPIVLQALRPLFLGFRPFVLRIFELFQIEERNAMIEPFLVFALLRCRFVILALKKTPLTLLPDLIMRKSKKEERCRSCGRKNSNSVDFHTWVVYETKRIHKRHQPPPFLVAT